MECKISQVWRKEISRLDPGRVIAGWPMAVSLVGPAQLLVGWLVTVNLVDLVGATDVQTFHLNKNIDAR